MVLGTVLLQGLEVEKAPAPRQACLWSASRASVRRRGQPITVARRAREPLDAVRDPDRELLFTLSPHDHYLHVMWRAWWLLLLRVCVECATVGLGRYVYLPPPYSTVALRSLGGVRKVRMCAKAKTQ